MERFVSNVLQNIQITVTRAKEKANRLQVKLEHGILVDFRQSISKNWRKRAVEQRA